MATAAKRMRADIGVLMVDFLLIPTQPAVENDPPYTPQQYDEKSVEPKRFVEDDDTGVLA